MMRAGFRAGDAIQDYFVLTSRLDSPQKTSPGNSEHNESWSTTSLLVFNDFLPMIHRFEDLYENSSAMMYFMKFLDQLEKTQLLKFCIHVEGFKSCSNGKDEFELQSTVYRACLDQRSEAEDIYKTYIASDSPSNISLPIEIQSNVEESFETQNFNGCFDEAQRSTSEQLKNRQAITLFSWLDNKDIMSANV